MKFSDYVSEVLQSEKEDWNVIPCWGSGTGPSYRDKFEISTRIGPARSWELEVLSHSHTAALKDNLAITIAWGLSANEDFQEPWANGFADPHATSSHVDFFYHGALVYRELYVTVDGGRVSLPLPEQRSGQLVVAENYAKVVALLNSLEGPYADEFERYMTEAGIVRANEVWP